MIVHFHAGHTAAGPLRKDTRNILFVDGSWSSDAVVRRLGEPGKERPGLTEDQTSTVMALLQSSTPMWSRLGPSMGQLDNYIRRLVRWIELIAKDLQGIGAICAVFHTSSPHRPSTLCLQIACQISGIQTVYLYTEWVAGRLLPMGFELFGSGLTPLGFNVSDYDSTFDVEKFAARAVLDEPPALEKRWFPVVSRSYRRGVALLLGWRSAVRLKRGVRNLLCRARAGGRGQRLNSFESEVDQDFSGSLGWTFREELETMKVQAAALEVLRGEGRKFAHADVQGRALVFYAHFQPEASTFPEQGPVFSSMLRALAAVRASGWNGPTVFREHPASMVYLGRDGPTRVGIARSPDFYLQIKETGGELQLPTESSGQWPDAIVATVAGTIALERAFRGLPTVVLGRPWFGDVPGAICLKPDGSWISDYDVSSQSDTICLSAKVYMNDYLSRKTITNVQGIGQVTAQKSPQHLLDYSKEMSRLADALMLGSQTETVA